MASILHPLPSNCIESIFPTNMRSFTLNELYKIIGCETVQMIYLADGRMMWMDEDGKSKPGLTLNSKATKLLQQAGGIPGDYILGKVLITNELEGGCE